MTGFLINDCPAKYVCKTMTGYPVSCCPNLLICVRLSGVTLELNDISELNPNLTNQEYRDGRWRQIDHFLVQRNRLLPEGYAFAEPAQLPIEKASVGWQVVRNYGEFQRSELNPRFLALEDEPVVLIEWCDNVIRAVHTESTQYGCLLSGETLLIDQYDCPIEYDFWRRSDQKMPKVYGDCWKEIDLPLGAALDLLVRQLNSTILCEEILYCNCCKASTYEGDIDWSECGHLRYVNELSSWAGAGYGEEDFIDDYQAAFLCLLNEIDLYDVDQATRNSRYETSLKQKLLNALETLDSPKLADTLWTIKVLMPNKEEMNAAIAYLETLDSSFPDGFQLCLQWSGSVRSSQMQAVSNAA